MLKGLGHPSRCPHCGLPLHVLMRGVGPELSYDFAAWSQLCKSLLFGGPSMCLARASEPSPLVSSRAWTISTIPRASRLGIRDPKAVQRVEFTDEQIRALLGDAARHPPCARHLGFELIDFSVEGGWAEVAFLPRPDSPTRPAGAGRVRVRHAGRRHGLTASISQPLQDVVPTLQISVSYLRPTPMSRVLGRGEVLRMVGSTAHLRAPGDCPTAPCSPPPGERGAAAVAEIRSRKNGATAPMRLTSQRCGWPEARGLTPSARASLSAPRATRSGPAGPAGRPAPGSPVNIGISLTPRVT